MSREQIITIFKQQLKGMDPDSEMAVAVALSIEIMHNDKKRISSQMNALAKHQKRSKCHSGF